MVKRKWEVEVERAKGKGQWAGGKREIMNQHSALLTIMWGSIVISICIQISGMPLLNVDIDWIQRLFSIRTTDG